MSLVKAKGTVPKLKPRRYLNLRIGRAVLRLRQFRGLDQQSLAAMCALSQPAVSLVESGRRLNLNTLDRISQGLGVSLSHLIELAEMDKLDDQVALEEIEADLACDKLDETVPWEQVKAELGL